MINFDLVGKLKKNPNYRGVCRLAAVGLRTHGSHKKGQTGRGCPKSQYRLREESLRLGGRDDVAISQLVMRRLPRPSWNAKHSSQGSQ